MDYNKYKMALEKFPQLLNASENIEAGFDTLFSELHKIIEYDYGIIFYLNAERMNVKYQKNYTKTDIFDTPLTYLTLPDKIKQEILSDKTHSFDYKSTIAKEMKLTSHKSKFLLATLDIRSTVFGFILLGKNKSDFTQEDKEIIQAYSSVCSYAIKDNELFDVFKIQFKVLQEDIEEKARAYKTIAEQNQKIIEADNAKNEFIANISHELRTPLNAILGFAEVLKEQFFGELNPKQLEYVGDIHISAIHLLGMINEILDISKIESNAMQLNKSKLEMPSLINEVVNIIKPLATKKKIKVTTNINVTKPFYGDYQKMQQILFNLLSNALKFTQDKGKIEIGAIESKKKLTLWVQDNGIGIDKKYHGKIFGKFVQLENTATKKESSTGLGLTITKELVKIHGGEIKLESKINEGTKFIIEFPYEIKEN